MNQSAIYSGEYGYHYRQQPTYPAQYGPQPVYPAQYWPQSMYPAQFGPQPVYQVPYQQGYNHYQPTAYQNYGNYYPVNYNYQNSVAHYCPACGTPVYVVYMGEQQGNRNGLAAIVVATLILIALDILFLRHK